MTTPEEQAFMLGPQGEHEHKWGPVEWANLTGNPHRKCQVEGCRFVSLDLSDDDGEGQEDKTYQVCLVLTVDATSPEEAAEIAYGWCTDTELTPPVMLVREGEDNEAGIFADVQKLPGVVSVDLSEDEEDCDEDE